MTQVANGSLLKKLDYFNFLSTILTIKNYVLTNSVQEWLLGCF